MIISPAQSSFELLKPMQPCIVTTAIPVISGALVRTSYDEWQRPGFRLRTELIQRWGMALRMNYSHTVEGSLRGRALCDPC